jgi:toxin ParE1/3/4
VTYRVVLSHDAEDDLLHIYLYVARESSVERAEALLDKLQDACRRLARFPKRGHVSPELERIDQSGFLEIAVHPYRIFFRIKGRTVIIHAVLDGRRNIGDLLAERLTRG